MRTIPKISEAEWEIMKILWASAPLNAAAIIDQLNAKESWHPRTVKTLLNRLVKKKALRFQKSGREYLYEPAVSEKACVRAESESFLQRVFGGALQPMLAHLVEERKLTPKEIKELKQILKMKED
jgi:BlaI family penicillinase repressor